MCFFSPRRAEQAHKATSEDESGDSPSRPEEGPIAITPSDHDHWILAVVGIEQVLAWKTWATGKDFGKRWGFSFWTQLNCSVLAVYFTCLFYLLLLLYAGPRNTKYQLLIFITVSYFFLYRHGRWLVRSNCWLDVDFHIFVFHMQTKNILHGEMFSTRPIFRWTHSLEQPSGQGTAIAITSVICNCNEQ